MAHLSISVAGKDADGDDAMMGLVPVIDPSTPASASSTDSVGSVGFDSKTYMSPDSPEKMVKPDHTAPTAESKMSDEVITVLIESASALEHNSDRHILNAILHLSNVEKVHCKDPRMIRLCRKLAECIATHVYSGYSSVLETELLLPTCHTCPPMVLPFTSWDQTACIEQLAYALLPSHIATIVVDLKHAVSMTHLLRNLREEGFLPQTAISMLASHSMPRAAVWAAMNVPEGPPRVNTNKRNRDEQSDNDDGEEEEQKPNKKSHRKRVKKSAK
jgi:hypothetical protein